MSNSQPAGAPMLGAIFKRDLAATATTMERWLTARLDGARDVKIAAISAAGGLSHEILIVDANWREGSTTRTQGLVVRLDPTKYRKRMESNLRREFDTLTVLSRESDVPVPRPFWYEDDASLLGAAFYVMERVDGLIAADQPPFQLQGWVAEMPADQRAVLWRNAIEVLAKIHRVPADKVLHLRRAGATGNDLQDHVRYWRRTYDWAMDGMPNPITDNAWSWIEANLPVDAPPGLQWGDARWSNLVFSGTRCAGVLDWEDVALGSPIVDLGRWLFADELHARAGLPRLEGFGDRQQTLDLWQQLTGLSAAHARWAEILTVTYAVGIIARMVRLQNELAGRTLGPASINVGAFNAILARWLETA